MSAQVIRLRPQPCQPTPEHFGDYLRRLANEFNDGRIAIVSIVATTHDGRVITRHSDEQNQISSPSRPVFADG